MTTPPSRSRAFSLQIFLPEGDPAGLRVVDKSLWTGCGLVFPRASFPAVKSRDEFGRPGIYVLVGPGEAGDDPTIYVGQGEPVRLRLEQHYANKDFWTWAVVFVSKDAWLNTARAQYLEARLLQRARETGRAKLDNQNSPRPPALAVAERADADSFLADILSLLPVLGREANGRTEWRDAAGRTLRQLQEAESDG